MPESFLITGGQGFIGAWVARRLLAEDAPFAILDRSPDDGILAQVISSGDLPRLHRFYGDISDPAFVEGVLKKYEATRIIHLAGLQIPACRADPVAGARVNVLGTINVFEAAHRSGRVTGIAYASSAAVAGEPADYASPIADDAPHVPRTHYGVFKAANEGNARVYFLEHGLSSIGLRPLVVYGAGREIGISSGPTKAVKAAVLGRPYTIGFTGVTGFSYADDVAAVFIACARARADGALSLNLRGETARVDRFIAAIEAEIPGARGAIRAAGPPLPVAYDFRETGLEKLLGNRGIPLTPIERGVRETVEIFRRLQREGKLPARDLDT